ncbi:ABC transporter ATP-binding protein [Diaminobutyricibacter sp. McL0618]|uniref:ABC transporter ATP-binding protein n=1 Tax=Leifsonia sp. McL0618 TaxID=3415677 RepID=UPI003CF4F85A
MTTVEEAAPRLDATRSGPALVIKELTKSFGTNTVVDHVSLTIPHGAFLGLLGPNGAGKTTLISMLSGLVQPDSGDCEVFGIDSKQDLPRAKKLLGVVPQDLAIYPELSARDNLRFFGAMYGLRGAELRDRTADALERVGLADRATKLAVGKFSGGQKRRLNIAAALLHQPHMLILDEPTVGVDPQSRNYIFETLRELNGSGMTILYVTHYMEEVEALCDEVAIIDRGQVIEHGRLTDVLNTHGKSIVRLRVSAAEQVIACAYLDTQSQVSWRDHDGGLEISSKNLQDVITVLTSILLTVSSTPEDCQILPPSLETVFINLTGNRLRDE